MKPDSAFRLSPLPLLTLAATLGGCSGSFGGDEDVPQKTTDALTDVQLVSNTFEPTIAVNPLNPTNIAMAVGNAIQVSTNSGQTFSAVQVSTFPPGFGGNGDSSLAYDSNGRLFWSFLGSFDIFVQEVNTLTGVPIGTAVDVSAIGGFPTGSNDKGWLAADRFASSPFRDNLYVAWAGPGGMRFSRSTNSGATWNTTPLVLSDPSDAGIRMVHVTVGADGAVYAAYHEAVPSASNNENPDGTTGRIVVRRSDDGGASFPAANRWFAYDAGEADMSYNFQFICTTPGPNGTCTAGTPAPRRLDRNFNLMLGSAQPFLLADPTNPQHLAVVASDDPTNVSHGAGFDDGSVYIVHSMDRGQTWGDPVQVDSGGGTTLQLMPTAATDIASQCVAVSYYDNRRGLTNPGGNLMLDMIVRTSPDGGFTWGQEARINDSAFDPDLNAGPVFSPNPPFPPGFVATTRIGEYNGVLVSRGVVWTGNGTSGQQQIHFDLSNPPVFTFVPPDLIADNCGPIDVGQAEATNVCGVPPLTITNDAPASFQSTTVVTWTATSGIGDTTTATQTVTIADRFVPVFTSVPADITTTACGSINIGTATARDDCDGSVTVTNDAPAVFPPGTTVVTWTATDDSGNEATATQRVNVILTDNAACCPAGTNVILGNSNNNLLNGTNGPDCILGRGGQDTINGNGGNDFIAAGDGDDNVNAGSGDDVVFGGSGQDTLVGGIGNDSVSGGDGNDSVQGGSGDDTLSGGQGQDVLQGQDGNDQLFGDDGDDNIQGGNGNDALVGGINNDTCNGGTGSNTFAQCEFGAPNSCVNTVQDGTETDLNCGGACPGCPNGGSCVVGSDCLSGLCSSGVCAPSPGAVSTNLTFTTDWGGGYCAVLNVTNGTANPTTGFTVNLNTNASTIYTSWNGTFVGSSGPVSATPCCSWNAVLSPGATDSSIGFCANRAVAGSGTLPFVVSTTGTF